MNTIFISVKRKTKKMNVIDDEKLKWKELAKQEILKTVVFNVNKTESISPTGEKGNYIVLDAPDWGIVIPEQDDKFLMVKQWRHGEKALSISWWRNRKR